MQNLKYELAYMKAFESVKGVARSNQYVDERLQLKNSAHQSLDRRIPDEVNFQQSIRMLAGGNTGSLTPKNLKIVFNIWEPLLGKMSV